MITRFVEVENVNASGAAFNWGKFMLARFDQEEWDRRSAVDGNYLVRGRGWDGSHVLVLDLQTGEGSFFRPGGMPSADLQKHNIWVCPMFEPFLTWLYANWDGVLLSSLPEKVTLPMKDAPPAMSGYRRDGSGRDDSDGVDGRRPAVKTAETS